MCFNLRSLLAVAAVAVSFGATASTSNAACDLATGVGCFSIAEVAKLVSSNTTLAILPHHDLDNPVHFPLQVPTLASKLFGTQLALADAVDAGETAGPVLVSVMKSL